MKQKDLTVIIVAGIVSAVVGIVLSKVLIAPPKNRQATVIIVDPISSDFQKTDPKYFNTSSLNPTRTIKIGDGSNPIPFKDK